MLEQLARVVVEEAVHRDRGVCICSAEALMTRYVVEGGEIVRDKRQKGEVFDLRKLDARSRMDREEHHNTNVRRSHDK